MGLASYLAYTNPTEKRRHQWREQHVNLQMNGKDYKLVKLLILLCMEVVGDEE